VIVEEAGGELTNYRGDVLDLDGREIVASNGRLHPAMTRLIGEYG
jgi:myo-inositol-1(or 4)-monophosphatase